jgi:hypothetical protein
MASSTVNSLQGDIPTMLIFFRTLFTVGAGFVIFVRLIAMCRRWNVHRRIYKCRSIIDCSFTEEGDSLCGRLGLRAKPNRRLVYALGVNNSLTTTDPDVHKGFLGRAARPLKTMSRPKMWQHLYDTAEAILEREVRNACVAGIVNHCGNGMGDIFLAPLVRCFCFRAVMQILFDTPALDDDDVATACEQINQQWIRSKRSGDGTAALEQSNSLNAALTRLLQGGREPDLSPQGALELILPAYETLWRVVLLTFVTACHRTSKPHTLLQADVRICLGMGNELEKQVRKIAKVCLHSGCPSSSQRNELTN